MIPTKQTLKISHYSIIGNCRTAALISKNGSLEWCCFPKFDSPSYFARILDPSGGHFSLTPLGPFESRQTYLDQTNVLQTHFTTQNGSATLTDFMSVREATVQPKELWPDEEILRILEVERGEVEFCLEFYPRSDYGKRGIRLRKRRDWGVSGSDGRKNFIFQSTISTSLLRLEERDGSHLIQSRFRISKGERAIFSLSYSDEAPAVIPPLQTALMRLHFTIAYWKKWAAQIPPQGQYKKIIERSALTLKLLNFAPSGAFVAAPTMSLPEWIGGSRNWDYRFCWLRDASFTTRALMQLGYLDEAKAFLNWLLHSTRLTWPRLQVVYTVYGESKVTETLAHWLSGFRESKPVRIGNQASQQVQLDVYGEVIDSFYALSKHLEPIDQETKKMVLGFGKAVADLWRQPDQGIWEFRGKPMHYTHSKVMCWVAMDRMQKLAKRYLWRLPFDPEQIAAEIRYEIESKAYDLSHRVYTRAFGEAKLDASLLVMPLVGYCDPNEPRYVLTRRAIITQLSKNDLIYRYALASDGIHEPEGAFTLCNFWLAESFARSGELEEARRWFNAVIRSLPDTGLLAEEIDPHQFEALGNHPQGFSHIGLIHAALAMQELQKNQSPPNRKIA